MTVTTAAFVLAATQLGEAQCPLSASNLAQHLAKQGEIGMDESELLAQCEHFLLNYREGAQNLLDSSTLTSNVHAHNVGVVGGAGVIGVRGGGGGKQVQRVDPHSFADLSQGVSKHVSVVLKVDFEQKVLQGSATLHLDRAKAGPLDLDARELRIKRVTDASGHALKFSTQVSDPVLGQRLRILRESPTQKVTIEYETSPEASGLQWLTPEQTAGKKHPFLFTQCQAVHARSVVPLQDTPAARITYEGSIVVPSALRAVMSAAPGTREPGPEPGTALYRFKMPQAIPPYLMALAVGDIGAKDLGPRSLVYAEPAVLEGAAWEFAEIESMIKKAEAILGPYPWERFDALVMPPSFPYGGMENPRVTFITPALINGDRSAVNVLVHELAHSWTGNLVTNATMDHFWLNEGFTVWAERRILEELRGKEASDLSAKLGRLELENTLKIRGPQWPHSSLQTDLVGEDPDEAFSDVPYEKGFLFLTLLEQTAGRPRWDAFVQEYLQKFRFASVTTEDFLAFLEEKLPGLAKKVGAQEWVYGKGIPANAPVFDSPVLKRVQEIAQSVGQGKLPAKDGLKDWGVDEWQIFFNALPEQVPHEACAWLDQNFMPRIRNFDVRALWLTTAARCRYEAAYPQISAFLSRWGRMKYLKPLYRALSKHRSTLPLARDLFSANRNSYHPIAAQIVGKQLDESTVEKK